jgi:phosphate transport system substrate-binding protein
MKNTLGLVAVGLLGVGLMGCGGGKRLNGAGSSFIYPMMTKWAETYKKEKNYEVNYQSKGSSAGIEMMTDKNVDFGCTDAPMNETQLAKANNNGGTVVHIPLVMGGVVPAYNLKEISRNKPLRFTGPVLAKIFLRQIKRWNDDELKLLNPGVELPDDPITVVHRSDGSGTTFIFTSYLREVTKNETVKWTKQGTDIAWPERTIGAKGTEGVAGEVSRTPGAIGYIELNHAIENKIPFGSVKNREGKFILADLASVTAAAQRAKIPDDLRFSIVNSPGSKTYPICGTTWAVLYANQTRNKQGKQLVDFVRWCTHDGQKYNNDLNYARLPENLVNRIDAKLDQIKVSK